MSIVQALLGLSVMIALCYAASENRREIRLSIIARGLALQLVFAVLLLKLPFSQQFFLAANRAIDALQEATGAGTSFIFGYLGGGPLPFREVEAGASFILAFQALPLVLVVSVISALLMYWRILPMIMRAFSFVFEKILGIGGALGLGISANAFLGMVESPLLIRPFLEKLNRGEFFGLMCAGMATIAGTMLALEAAIISDVVPNAIGHLISCSIITLPAVVYVSHLLVPDNSSVTRGDGDVDRGASSAMDAVATGTQNGLQLYLNIIAMIIVIVSLVFLVNLMLGLLPEIGGSPVTLEGMLGYLMAPLAFMIGIPWNESIVAGELLGTRVVLTEFVAYIRLGELSPELLSERSRIIVTYALCGFANLVSLGIMITGLVTMVPSRRQEILDLGFKSIVAGTVATCSTAALVGLLI